jgi:hypothetical protein
MPATTQPPAGSAGAFHGQRPFRLADLFGTPLPGPSGSADEIRRSCSQAILQVLCNADRPLTTLDILDELGHRYHCWTSSTVRHTLADLVERGLLIERRDLRPHCYEPASAQASA